MVAGRLIVAVRAGAGFAAEHGAQKTALFLVFIIVFLFGRCSSRVMVVTSGLFASLGASCHQYFGTGGVDLLSDNNTSVGLPPPAKFEQGWIFGDDSRKKGSPLRILADFVGNLVGLLLLLFPDKGNALAFRQTGNVVLHGTAIVVVGFQKLALPFPRAAIYRTTHLQLVDYALGYQVAADILHVDGLPADGAFVDVLWVFVGFEVLSDALFAESMPNYNDAYPQNSRRGLSKMSKQIGHLRREVIVCLTKTRLGPKDSICEITHGGRVYEKGICCLFMQSS